MMANTIVLEIDRALQIVQGATLDDAPQWNDEPDVLKFAFAFRRSDGRRRILRYYTSFLPYLFFFSIVDGLGLALADLYGKRVTAQVARCRSASAMAWRPYIGMPHLRVSVLDARPLMATPESDAMKLSVLLERAPVVTTAGELRIVRPARVRYRAPDELVVRSVSMPSADWDYLRALGNGNASRGARILIEQMRLLQEEEAA